MARRKLSQKTYTEKLDDGSEATTLEPGVCYLFDNGKTRLWFVKSMLVTDKDNNLSVKLVFQDINGQGKLIAFTNAEVINV